jgi:transcriptional regulator with XRE-family HTH domain
VKTPKQTDEAFIGRLRQLVRAAGSVAEIERLAGLKASTLKTYLQGSEPTRPILIKLAAAGRVSVNWLATGQGNERPLPPPPQADRFDPELMKWIIEDVEDALTEYGIVLTGTRKASVIMDFYEMFRASRGRPQKARIFSLLKNLA